MNKLFILIVVVVTCLNANVFAESTGNTGKGQVSGRALLISGKPMLHAMVMFYVKENGPAPSPERYWRVPEIVIPAGPDGAFTAELQAGDYYVGAIGRESSQLIPGPPVAGDYLALVRDKSGKPVVVSVVAGKTIECGVLKGAPYHALRQKNNIKTTTIEGVVTLKDGAAVPGAFVFAFHSPERGSKPVFASEKTDKKGRYRLRVDGDGTFYVKARETYGGGKPQNGELVGMYGENDPDPVTAASGKRVTGINVKLLPIERPDDN